MARFEATAGKYVYLEVQGIEYRVYFEESGQASPSCASTRQVPTESSGATS